MRSLKSHTVPPDKTSTRLLSYLDPRLLLFVLYLIIHKLVPQRHKYLVPIFTLLVSTISVAIAERVYDCSTQSTAVATYSLDEVGECPAFEKTYKNKTHIRAQILQRSGQQMLEGFQCQLVIRREACYCSTLGNRKLSFPNKLYKKSTLSKHFYKFIFYLRFFNSRPSPPSE